MNILRKTVILMTCILLVLTVSLSTDAASSYRRGDADGDNEITIMDATVIQRVLVQIPVQYFNEKAADVDNEGLDITDATFIQRHLTEMDIPYQIGEIVTVQEPATEDKYELPVV